MHNDYVYFLHIVKYISEYINNMILSFASYILCVNTFLRTFVKQNPWYVNMKITSQRTNIQ